MGAFHATGQHLPKDPAAAVHWYERAADAGNPRASVNLAVMYANGEGVERNLERARTLLDDAEYLGLDVTSLRETLGLEGGPDD
jgi:TPR repeat protein